MAWIDEPLDRDLAHVLRVQASDEKLLRAHLGLYRHVMFGSSGLSRSERETIAVVVSRLNECFY